MTNQLICDIISTTGIFAQTNFEIPVEQELLLADYDRPVFKIVKTTIDHAVTQKYINGGKIIIEGFFRVSVWYQPPSGGDIATISKKIPFRKETDVGTPPLAPYFIYVTGRCRYVNTRAVSSAKLDIRAVYNFSVKGYTVSPQQIGTAVNSKTVCCDTEELNHFCLCAAGSRTFSAESEITFPHSPEKILDIFYSYGKMASVVYGDKVNIKGEITADIAYTADSSAEIQHIVKVFPYNQVVDTPGAAEDNIAFGQLNITGFNITLNPDTKAVRCIVTSTRDVCVFRKSAVISINDTFSKKYDYKTTRKKIMYDSRIIPVYKEKTVTVEDTVPEGYTPVYAMAKFSPVQLVVEEGKNSMTSKLTVSVIAKNEQGEYDCFMRSTDIYPETDSEITDESEYLLTLQAVECTPYLTGDILKVKLEYSISGYVLAQGYSDVVVQFEEDTEKPLQMNKQAIVLYYAAAGEKLFDIAQRYKTDVSLIAGENNIDGKLLTEDRMLYIPAFGQ